jgi:hypothetical protein
MSQKDNSTAKKRNPSKEEKQVSRTAKRSNLIAGKPAV